MDRRKVLHDMSRLGVAFALVGAMVACGERGAGVGGSVGVRETHFPGQITAAGGTSGEVMSRAKPPAEGKYSGGTPGIAGGAGGNTSGAAIGGTTQESGRGPAGSVAPPGGQGTASQGSGAQASGGNDGKQPGEIPSTTGTRQDQAPGQKQ